MRTAKRFSATFWILVLLLLGVVCHGFPQPSLRFRCATLPRRCGDSIPLYAASKDTQDTNGDTELNGDVLDTINGENRAPAVVSIGSSTTQPPFRENLYILSVSGLVGILSGLAIVVFKTLIQLIREVCYTDAIAANFTVLLPMVGGIGVGLLVLFFGEFAPGLRGTIREVDTAAVEQRSRWNRATVDRTRGDTSSVRPVPQEVARAMRKSVGAALTLGTGNRYVRLSTRGRIQVLIHDCHFLASPVHVLTLHCLSGTI